MQKPTQGQQVTEYTAILKTVHARLKMRFTTISTSAANHSSPTRVITSFQLANTLILRGRDTLGAPCSPCSISTESCNAPSLSRNQDIIPTGYAQSSTSNQGFKVQLRSVCCNTSMWQDQWLGQHHASAGHRPRAHRS